MDNKVIQRIDGVLKSEDFLPQKQNANVILVR